MAIIDARRRGPAIVPDTIPKSPPLTGWTTAVAGRCRGECFQPAVKKHLKL